MNGRIVLIAGRVREHDRTGHHDYLAGCRLLADLVRRAPGADPCVVTDGWPDDDSVFDGAASLVFYEGGGGKQAFLQEEKRIERVRRCIDAGAGVMMLHQGLGFPRSYVEMAQSWMGGCYVPGRSERGHWKTAHSSFPVHPVTRGVASWSIKDGWLNHLEFVDAMQGVTPLVWSGREHAGSAQGGRNDIAAWTYERPSGGRSFAFTGIDAHSAWSHPGLRRLLANAALWISGIEVPEAGADIEIDDPALRSYLTPRRSRAAKIVRRIFSPAGWSPKW